MILKRQFQDVSAGSGSQKRGLWYQSIIREAVRESTGESMGMQEITWVFPCQQEPRPVLGLGYICQIKYAVVRGKDMAMHVRDSALLLSQMERGRIAFLSVVELLLIPITGELELPKLLSSERKHFLILSVECEPRVLCPKHMFCWMKKHLGLEMSELPKGLG